MERQRVFEEQILEEQGMHPGNAGHPIQQQQHSGFTLPAALLAQYPALQGLQWDNLQDEGGGDISRQNSFDAGSSGGEGLFEDDGEGSVSGYDVGPGTGYGANGRWEGQEWASDYEGR